MVLNQNSALIPRLLGRRPLFLHIVNMGIDKRATLPPPPLPPVHVTKIVKIYSYRLCMFICVDFRGLWADNLYLLSCK